MTTDLDRVNETVAEFCAKVAAEPLAFFSECDLQDMLTRRLQNTFPKLISTSVRRGPRKTATTCYQTGMVHREYGAGNGRRLDIAILDDREVPAIDDWRLRIGNHYLRPRFGFELGTELGGDATEHLRNDSQKLNDQVAERGYIIHIFRDFTLADNDTKTRKATEEAIERRFYVPVRECPLSPKIRIVAFVLRLAHMHRRIWGKCEMFRMAKGRWVKTNLKDVRRAVLEELGGSIS